MQTYIIFYDYQICNFLNIRKINKLSLLYIKFCVPSTVITSRLERVLNSERTYSFIYNTHAFPKKKQLKSQLTENIRLYLN